MIELNAREFASVIPLLAGIKQKVLPYAICESINPGRIFVNRRPNPQIAAIWSPVGYYFLAGEPSQVGDQIHAEIGQVLAEIFVPASQATGETGFILISSTTAWKEYLPTLLPGRKVIEIYRRPFAFDPAQFAAQGNWRARIPDGFRLQPVNAAMAEQVGIPASWASPDDFLAYGIGFVLLDGDQVASACTSVFASHDRVEIDVHTAEGYRRRGFAVITASALIEACLQCGKQPNWECFWDNQPSIALAGKLGFRAQLDYPVYYWEE